MSAGVTTGVEIEVEIKRGVAISSKIIFFFFGERCSISVGIIGDFIMMISSALEISVTRVILTFAISVASSYFLSLSSFSSSLLETAIIIITPICACTSDGPSDKSTRARKILSFYIIFDCIRIFIASGDGNLR